MCEVPFAVPLASCSFNSTFSSTIGSTCSYTFSSTINCTLSITFKIIFSPPSFPFAPPFTLFAPPLYLLHIPFTGEIKGTVKGMQPPQQPLRITFASPLHSSACTSSALHFHQVPLKVQIQVYNLFASPMHPPSHIFTASGTLKLQIKLRKLLRGKYC